MLCACATVPALETLYSRWAMGPLLFINWATCFEKLENPWSTSFTAQAERSPEVNIPFNRSAVFLRS